jgi:hypothetical protein
MPRGSIAFELPEEPTFALEDPPVGMLRGSIAYEFPNSLGDPGPRVYHGGKGGRMGARVGAYIDARGLRGSIAYEFPNSLEGPYGKGGVGGKIYGEDGGGGKIYGKDGKDGGGGGKNAANVQPLPPAAGPSGKGCFPESDKGGFVSGAASHVAYVSADETSNPMTLEAITTPVDAVHLCSAIEDWYLVFGVWR